MPVVLQKIFATKARRLKGTKKTVSDLSQAFQACGQRMARAVQILLLSHRCAENARAGGADPGKVY